MNNEDFGQYMEAQVALMEPEKKEALINAIKLVFQAFVEDETQGVILMMDKGQCMTTMGLNATYYETARLVDIAMLVFANEEARAENETKH